VLLLPCRFDQKAKTLGALVVFILLETPIIYEYETDSFLNRRCSAERDRNRCICGPTCHTNDDAVRDHAASPTLCAKDHDGHT
jgi:hypothetical protein